MHILAQIAACLACMSAFVLFALVVSGHASWSVKFLPGNPTPRSIFETRRMGLA